MGGPESQARARAIVCHAATPYVYCHSGGEDSIPMEELLRTNDLVLISYVEALLRDARIAYVVLDQNMSVIEGSLGILPRRVMVSEDRLEAARSLMESAGIADELEKPRKKAR